MSNWTCVDCGAVGENAAHGRNRVRCHSCIAARYRLCRLDYDRRKRDGIGANIARCTVCSGPFKKVRNQITCSPHCSAIHTSRRPTRYQHRPPPKRFCRVCDGEITGRGRQFCDPCSAARCKALRAQRNEARGHERYLKYKDVTLERERQNRAILKAVKQLGLI